MKQIVLIHGGDSFPSYDLYLQDLKNKVLDIDRLRPRKTWKDSIIDTFSEADILTPTMPNSANAQYDEWAIWFEKIIPYFTDDTRLIGHSLGAMFLAKYLHTSPLKTPVRQLHLVAAGYDEDASGYGSFGITESASGLNMSADEVHLYHSEDDPVVPYCALDKFKNDNPTATIHRFTDRDHFIGAEFPEIILELKK